MTTDKKTLGVYHKFNIQRVDGTDSVGGKHHECDYFVLDATHDVHAYAALMAYADSCETDFPQLAQDIRTRYKPVSN